MRKNKEERNEYLREYRKKKGYHKSDATNDNPVGVQNDNLARVAGRLVDPFWRPRLELICESLGNLSSEVYQDGIAMDTWAELLSVTA